MTGRDLRAQHKASHHGKRPWPTTTGITLHHTACLLGEKPARWLTCGAHAGITRAGLVLRLADPDVVLMHGGDGRGTAKNPSLLNLHDVGIELDGWYEGVAGKRSTMWDDPSLAEKRDPMLPTSEMIASAHELIRELVGASGGSIRYIHAHRQGSESRRADPGSAIWQAIALPMMAELGLTDGGPGWRCGSGRPIPEEWDPRCVGVKY